MTTSLQTPTFEQGTKKLLVDGRWVDPVSGLVPTYNNFDAIVFEDRDITTLAAYRRAREGVIQVLEDPRAMRPHDRQAAHGTRQAHSGRAAP